MTDYAEEQEMELEALEAIYDDLFTKTADAPPAMRVRVLPVADGEDGDCHVEAALLVTFTPTYPDAAPDYSVELVRGLNEVHQEEIDALLAEAVEENLGSAMVYSLADALQQYLADHNEPGASDDSMHAQMIARQQAKDRAAANAEAEAAAKEQAEREEEEEANAATRLAVVDPVTPESFAAWLERFDAETGAAADAAGERRLTGKELFQGDSSLVHSDERGDDDYAVDEEEEAALAAAGAAAAATAGEEEDLAVDESLFDAGAGLESGSDDDDLDLDSDSDGEEEEEEDGGVAPPAPPADDE